MGPTAADLQELGEAGDGAPIVDPGHDAIDPGHDAVDPGHDAVDPGHDAVDPGHGSAGLLGELAASAEVPFPGLASADDPEPAVVARLGRGSPADVSSRSDLAGLAGLLRAARDAGSGRGDPGLVATALDGTTRSSIGAVVGDIGGSSVGAGAAGAAAGDVGAPQDGDGERTVVPGDLDLVVSSGRRSAWAAVTRARALRPPRTRRASSAIDDRPTAALAGDLTETGPRTAPAAIMARRRLPVSWPVAAVVAVGVLLAAGLAGVQLASGSAPVASHAGARPVARHHPTSTPGAGSSTATPLKSSIPKSAILPPGAHPVLTNPTASVPTGSSGSTGSAAGTPTGPDLTRSAAALVIGSLVPRRAAALADRSPSELAAIDTGAALQGDTALVAGSGTVATVDAAHPQVTVISGQAYPLSAVGLLPGAAGGTAVDELVLVSQAAAGQPWMVSLVVDVPTAQVDQAAGAGPVTSIGTSTLDALAASWQQWAGSGSAPSGGVVPFAAGGAYSSVGESTANQVALSAMQGIHESVTFQAEPGTAVLLPGQDTLCGAVLEVAVFTGASGGTVTQPPNRSTWGASVAPGHYASVTEQSVAQVCMASTGGSVQVMGGSSGLFAVTAS